MNKSKSSKSKGFLIWDGKTARMKKPMIPKFEYENHGNQIEGQWVNKLFHCDNRIVFSALSRKPFRKDIEKAGGIRMIYIDPPFDVGANFVSKIKSKKNDSVPLLHTAYSDKWGSGANSYLTMIYQRLKEMHKILSDDGCMLVHCDWRTNSKIRLLMDEVFSTDNFLNEIIWSYRSGGASRNGSLAKKHDSILFYRKTERFKVRTLKERQYLAKPFIEKLKDEEGRYYTDTLLRDVFDGEMAIVRNGRIQTYNTRPVLNLSRERLNYPTQKPEGLLSLLIELTTKEGDVVADFFCGSGTTLAVAERLGRKWIGSDTGTLSIHTTRKRLLSLYDGKSAENPFEIVKLQRKQKETPITVVIHKQGDRMSVELTHFSCSVENTKWKDGIDYWAVGFVCKHETRNMYPETLVVWCDFRKKNQQEIITQSGWFKCVSNPSQALVVQVIDIFGNEYYRKL